VAGGTSTKSRPKAAAPPRVCPDFHEAVELVGRRWTGAILFALGEGPLRFRQLTDCVTGVSDRLLSQRLRELEAEGIVERSVQNGAPVQVTYSLTPKGTALRPAIIELREWAKAWKKS
jgi:DNA-binding HxlR family transcriptional regulator